MPRYADIDFIRLDPSGVADSLRQQVHEWITVYGKLLHDIARTNMAAVHTKLDKLSDELFTDPTDLEELKAVLQVINRSINHRSIRKPLHGSEKCCR